MSVRGFGFAAPMADQSLRQFLRHVINVALGGVRLIALTARDVFGSTTVQGGRKGAPR